MPVNLMRRIGTVPTLLLCGVLACAGAIAQEGVVPLQFSFSDPGARSMGFGGAFVALADDATAAFANPAGLVQLVEPEISIEGRRWSYSTPFTESGRAEGLPSNFGIDNTEGLRTATSDDDVNGLSYLSFVYPQNNWSLALYRHESANFEFFSETQGLFGGGTDCCQVRELDQRARNDFEIVSYGLSAAYRVNDRFNLGIGVDYYDTSFVSVAALFATDDDTIESIFGPNSYLPERSVLSERITLDDSDWSLTGGFLWRISENWSVGGVYREAPEIPFTSELIAGELLDLGVPSGEVFNRVSAELELPTVYGLGFAYRAPDGALTVSFQWDRIEYSNIVDSLNLDDRAIDDADELHLGAEYVFLDSTPIVAVRLGTWLDPDHQMRSTDDNPFGRALLPRGDDEIHYAAGLGLAIENFQLDVGADFSDHFDTLSLSAIYSF